MSFLLMVFLTLVCLFDSYPTPPWKDQPGLSVLLTALVVGLIGLHAFWVSNRVCVPLRRDPSQQDELMARYERRRLIHQFGQLALFVLALTLCGWGWAAQQLWRWGDTTLPCLPFVTLLPFLLGNMVSWLFFYDADLAAQRAACGISESDHLSGGWLVHRQFHPNFGTRWTYVLFHLRQKLALVLVPVILMVIQQELFRLVPESWYEWQGLINVLALVILAASFTAMPWLIRLVLGLKPLPTGPLRDRLMEASRRLGFRASNILVWNTRSGMANAMVIGLVPWVRYVVFTDRLLEEFTPDEVEAVFGHEVGHVRHAHMVYYLVFLTLSMTSLGLLSHSFLLPWLSSLCQHLANAWPAIVPEDLAEWFGPQGELSIFPVVGVVLTYVFVVFGYLSRQCERQADVFGCRAVSCESSDCWLHGEETKLANNGRALCRSGIHTFIRALEKVALVNGICREKPGFLHSWQHGSIARRVAFLERLIDFPEDEPRFQRRLKWFKWGLVSGLVLVFAVVVAL